MYVCVCAHVSALRTPKRRLRFIVIVLYVKWHLKINLWFNCQVLCVLWLLLYCFYFSFPACTWKEKKRKEKTEITKTTTITTTTASTTATHSIQGKTATKQVFKFTVRHYYSLIRLGSWFCFFICIFACSLQKNVMSAWGTIFRICAHSIEREFLSIDSMLNNDFAVCRHHNNSNNKNKYRMCDRRNLKTKSKNQHQQQWNNNNQMY